MTDIHLEYIQKRQLGKEGEAGSFDCDCIGNPDQKKIFCVCDNNAVMNTDILAASGNDITAINYRSYYLGWAPSLAEQVVRHTGEEVNYQYEYRKDLNQFFWNLRWKHQVYTNKYLFVFILEFLQWVSMNNPPRKPN